MEEYELFYPLRGGIVWWHSHWSYLARGYDITSMNITWVYEFGWYGLQHGVFGGGTQGKQVCGRQASS
jgi:hypothetical protein